MVGPYSLLPMRAPRLTRTLLIGLALAVADVGVSRLATAATLDDGATSLLWPPSGFEMAALCLLGLRFWPAIALGDLAASVAGGVDLGIALPQAAGNVLEGVVGAAILIRLLGPPRTLRHLHHVLGIVLLAAPAGAVLSATAGVGGLYLHGEVGADALWPVWLKWFLSDVTGVTLVAPAILALAHTGRPRVEARRVIEALLLAVALVGACLAGLGGAASQGYLVFPVLVWAALRFALTGAALASLAVAAFAMAITQAGGGPLAAADVDLALRESQSFLMLAAVTSLLLATGIREREEDRALLQGIMDNSPAVIFVKDSHGRYRFVSRAFGEFNNLLFATDPVGRTAREVFPPETAAGMERMDAAAIAASGPIETESPIPFDGQVRHFLTSRVALPQADGGHTLLGVSTDITERKRRDSLLARRADQQAAVGALARRALAETRYEALIQAGVAEAAAALGADLAAVLALEGEAPGDELVLRAAHGWDPSAIGQARLPAAAADARDEAVPLRELVEPYGVSSGRVAAIAGRDRLFGLIAVHFREPPPASDDDAEFLQAVAHVLATAIDRARAHEAVTELARERGQLFARAQDAAAEERRRVSEALHDDALQSLLAARQDLYEAPSDVNVERARDTLTETARRLRGLVSELHPVTLAHAGLRAAVESVAAEQAQRGGFAVEVDVAVTGTAHDELIVSLARELLVNAAKHARATRVTVEVAAEDGGIRLAVADDGVGVDPAAVRGAVARGHIGLAAAAQRVESAGGRFRIRPGDGGGTVARLWLPG